MSGKQSFAYVGLTALVMRKFESPYAVEPDFSSAANHAVAAAITGGDLVLTGLNMSSPQPDARILPFLNRAGARVTQEEAGVRKAHIAVPATSERCVACHDQSNPGIVAQWKESTHARKGVGCYDCHQAQEGEVDAWHHEGQLIATLVTPKDCARCHADISAEFQASHHASAGQILVSSAVRELSVGKPISFVDRGPIALKGFDDPVRLFEVPLGQSD